MQPSYNFIVRILYTILYYVLVPICVQYICIIFLLRNKYFAPLQHRHNWCHPPLTTSRRPSRANGDAPVPAPIVALPFRRLLMSVHLTPVPPMSHTVHPSHPASNQPAQKIQCFLILFSRYDKIQPIQYNPDDTIKSIR